MPKSRNQLKLNIMANIQSKIKIYKFMLSRLGSSDSITNNDFYSSVGDDITDQNTIFGMLANAYYESFNGQFKKDQKGNRAISISKKELIGYKSEHKIIHGFLNGGITNTEFKQFDIDNSSESERAIERNKVLGQDYYFLVWLPENTNLGFVFLQYNDSVIRGITSAFFDHFDSFLKNYNFKISKQPYAPKEVIETYISHSTICEIEFIQHKMVDEKSPLIGEMVSYKLSTKVGGINIPILSYNSISSDMLREIKAVIGISDEADLSTMIRYKKGKTTRKANIENNKLIPDIDIPENIIDEQITTTSIEKMFKFVNKYISMANTEIGNLS